jgi:nucleotidyltransferase substrate binding protein (TIGR01987 family)
MDVRWEQRFNSYKKAFEQLHEAINIMSTRELTKLEKQGVIHTFEFTHELAWKTLKDFLESLATSDLYGSKDVTKEAFKTGLIQN